MRSTLTLTAAAAALALAPTAAEAKVFVGKTSQQKKASLHTGADGIPTIVRLPWVATNCRKADMQFSDATEFRPDAGDATVDTVKDGGTYRLKGKRGLRHTVTTVLDGKRTGEAWSGTLKTNAIVRRDGKKIDTCNTTITWSVR
jgi:hypothetical protein